MMHQTKTLVDAAKKAGVEHIVNQDVFANHDCTDSKFSWFALVECYIEGSGIPWTHLHPNMLMDRMLNVLPPTGGSFPALWGQQQVGYVAVTDIAATTAKVLRDRPEHHASKNYYLSTETMTGPEPTGMLSEVPGRTITCDVRHPADMEALFKAGGLKVEDRCAKSSIEFCTQLADGRLGYFGTVRDNIPTLLRRPGTNFRASGKVHRSELLDLVHQCADETLKE